LAIYVDCKTWGCLPQAGGIYDQDPEILEAFTVIENEINRTKKQEMEKQARKR